MNRVASLLIVTFLIQILIVGCGTKKTKEQLYAEAKRFERNEQYKEAIEVYEQFVKEYPRASSADSVLFSIGQIYSNNLAQFEKSIETHQRLISQYPESKMGAQSLFMIGYHFANDIKDLDKAKEYYSKFLASYPNNELCSSVQWELDNLGKDINDIDFLKSDTKDQTASDSQKH
ncbi:MAG: tetratricopeptide repeat protein [Candidatus Zhuqueibacterota bacterium]